MSITKAIITDVEDLVRMGRAFFHEAEWHKLYTWDDEDAGKVLTDLISNPDAIVYIAKEMGVAIGMASALTYPLWYNTKIKTAQEFFLYVDPDRRKDSGRVGHRLKTKLEEDARAMGAETMAMGSVEAMPALDMYYARSGYAPSEKTFIKRL